MPELVPTSGRVRPLFVLLVVGGTAVGLLIGLPLLLGGLFMAALTAPSCGASIDPARAGMPSESFMLPIDGGESPAYFIPARQPNGWTVIVAPTMNGGRGTPPGEIAVLVAAGAHVLTYTSRTCALGVGNSLGAHEAGDVLRAVDHLLTRVGVVDPDRIGAYGFSSAGAAVLMAAARDPRIAAAAASGNYENFPAQIDASVPGNLGLLAPLFRLAAEHTYRAYTGIGWEALDPIGSIDRIPPRPLLLLYGDAEPGLDGGRAMAARSGARLVIVPDSGHGGYLAREDSRAVFVEALTALFR
jgi:hypothetical protein